MPEVTQRRVSVSLSVGGALAILGGFMMSANLLIAAGVVAGWAPWAAHLVAAALAGAAIAGIDAIRPTREPIAAAAAGIGAMVVLFVAAPHSSFSWVVARGAHPYLVALVITAGTGLVSAITVHLLRSRLPLPPTTTRIVLFATLVTGGAITLALQFAWSYLDVDPSANLTMLVMFPMVIVAGGIVQYAVPVYRPWVCGSGLAPIMVVGFAKRLQTDPEGAAMLLMQAFTAGLMIALLVWLSQLGARVGWRLSGRQRNETQVPLSVIVD
jgi:hypothetical protein